MLWRIKEAVVPKGHAKLLLLMSLKAKTWRLRAKTLHALSGSLRAFFLLVSPLLKLIFKLEYPFGIFWEQIIRSAFEVL